MEKNTYKLTYGSKDAIDPQVSECGEQFQRKHQKRRQLMQAKPTDGGTAVS